MQSYELGLFYGSFSGQVLPKGIEKKLGIKVYELKAGFYIGLGVRAEVYPISLGMLHTWLKIPGH